MRQWINMFEGFAVPVFTNFITDDLISEIIRTGKFVSHGTDLEDSWNNSGFEHYMEQVSPALVEKPFSLVRYTPEFRECLHMAALQTAENEYQQIIDGCPSEGIPPLDSSSKIYRGITGNLSANGTVGIYWSQLKSQSLHRFIDEKVGGILMAAEMRDVTVNWQETIRSRIDFSNGGDEHEIQLAKGSPVKAFCVRVNFVGGRPVLQPLSYVFKKA